MCFLKCHVNKYPIPCVFFNVTLTNTPHSEPGFINVCVDIFNPRESHLRQNKEIEEKEEFPFIRPVHNTIIFGYIIYPCQK